MAGIKFEMFRGEFPYLHPRKLPPGGALTCTNAKLESGVLTAVKTRLSVETLSSSNPKSLYRYDPIDGTKQWLYSPNVVNYVRWPLGDDIHDRVIYSSTAYPLGPRVSSSALMGVDGFEPTNWRPLGIPAPTSPPKATVMLTGEPSDIPEVRYYVCTFVNEWGQEGPPSLPSNQVEVRLGQYVDVTQLPVPPSGQYNITQRRIYRVNATSTGQAVYQFVAELNVIATSYTAATSVTQESPSAKIQFPGVHGFLAGQELEITGTFGPTGSKFNIAAVTLGATETRVTTSSAHGLTTGMGVVLSELNAQSGVKELNDVRSVVTVTSTTEFILDRLNGVDTTPFAAFIPATSGKVQRTLGLDSLKVGTATVLSVPDTDEAYIGRNTSDDIALLAGGSISFRVASGLTFQDIMLSSTLQEALSSETYDPPNPKTIGLVKHPSGFLVGHYDNNLCMSEVGAPHGWPIEYRQATDGNIIGLGIFGNYIFIGTTKQPYLAFGNMPSEMIPVKLPIQHSCINARAIVDVGSGIVYPSPDGLVYVTQGQPQVITEGLFDRDDWQAMDPGTFLAFNWEGKYLCFFGDGTGVRNSFVLDPTAIDTGVRYFSDWATGGYYDAEEDILYVAQGTTLFAWDNGTTKKTCKYLTRVVRVNKPCNFSLLRVEADNYPVTVKILGDGGFRHSATVVDDTPVRLPGGYKATDWQVILETNATVTAVALGQSMRDFAQDPI